MITADNVALVRRLYESAMAPEVVAEIVDDNLEWNITPGFPRGGIYRGWSAVSADFFGELLPQVDQWNPIFEDFYGAEDSNRVFVVGYYSIVSKAGNSYRARYIHEWTVEGGKLVRLFQSADSHTAQQAIADR